MNTHPSQTQDAKWRLKGLDTFEGEYYDIPGEYDSQAEVEKAARDKLNELEKTQPAATSGGQGFGGIQDRVFIVTPEGGMRRFR